MALQPTKNNSWRPRPSRPQHGFKGGGGSVTGTNINSRDTKDGTVHVDHGRIDNFATDVVSHVRIDPYNVPHSIRNVKTVEFASFVRHFWLITFQPFKLHCLA